MMVLIAAQMLSMFPVQSHWLKYVRVSFTSCMLLTQGADGRSCTVTHTMHVDLALPLPGFKMKKKSLQEAEWIGAMLRYFLMSKVKERES